MAAVRVLTVIERDLKLLAETLVAGELMLFLGAGASASAVGLPGGAALADTLTGMLAPGEATGASGLPHIASRFEAAKGRSALVRTLRANLQAPPSTTTDTTADWVARLPVQTVVTTNYDLLLEEAYRRAGVDPQRICSPKDLLALSAGRRHLFKIHGSVDTDESDGAPLIVTEFDFYRHFLAGHSVFHDVLKAWFLTKRVLFIGFGLRDPNFLQIYFAIRRMIDGPHQPASRKFFAVQRNAHKLDVASWRRQGVTIIISDASDFLGAPGMDVGGRPLESLV